MGRLLPAIRCSLPLLCCLSWSSWFLPACHALPLCTDSRAPVALNGTLGFCSAYVSMNVSDAACAGVVKLVLCAKCNPFSAELFNSSSKIRTVPILCNYTSSAGSAESKDSTQDYCKLVWDTCQNVTILNSPFQPPLQGGARLPSSSSQNKALEALYNLMSSLPMGASLFLVTVIEPSHLAVLVGVHAILMLTVESVLPEIRKKLFSQQASKYSFLGLLIFRNISEAVPDLFAFDYFFVSHPQ